MIDLDFQHTSAHPQRSGSRRDLRADHLVPDQPGLMPTELFAETGLLEDLAEQTADRTGLLHSSAPVALGHRWRRRRRPPTSWPLTAQIRVRGIQRQLKPSWERSMTMAGIDR